MPPLFFLHIPKTAGRSLATMIGQRFAAGRSKDDRPDLPLDDPNGLDFVTAHADIGYAARFRTPPVIVTFLRDPIERALSWWRFTLDEERLREMIAAGDRNSPRQQAAVEFRRLAVRMPLLELMENHPQIARRYLGNVHLA
ncbi:MAG: sulfotransferase family 2 domain-containing protein [Rhodospirillaceae bacterium]|nr:sulfotransferase family 2 domain-containing protein [Rhodospirillaceae bacterium]